MGLMRWLRGGEENSASASVISAGLAEIDGLFRPSRHKQTEHVEQLKQKRLDVAVADDDIDLERGVAVIRARHAKGQHTGDNADAEPGEGSGTGPARDRTTERKGRVVADKPDARKALAAGQAAVRKAGRKAAAARKAAKSNNR